MIILCLNVEDGKVDCSFVESLVSHKKHVLVWPSYNNVCPSGSKSREGEMAFN
jgi:hypothetical protein